MPETQIPADPALASGPAQVKLSATIITYNEERRIADCILSVHDWCDEVLVLDSHSTDKTRTIACSFPKVRFETHDFDGHIQQKNRAIEMARGEWIFSLDADENATPELARSVLDFMQKNPQADGARVKRLTYHLGVFLRYGGWYHSRIRLLRKGRGVWGGENPHDMIRLKDKPEYRAHIAPYVKGDLIHYSFKDLSDQLETINKFSSIVAFTRNTRGKRFSALKLIYKPAVKFIELYFLKLGLLDGLPGLIVASLTSYSAFVKLAKLYELQKTDIERPSNLRPDYKA